METTSSSGNLITLALATMSGIDSSGLIGVRHAAVPTPQQVSLAPVVFMPFVPAASKLTAKRGEALLVLDRTFRELQLLRCGLLVLLLKEFAHRHRLKAAYGCTLSRVFVHVGFVQQSLFPA